MRPRGQHQQLAVSAASEAESEDSIVHMFQSGSSSFQRPTVTSSPGAAVAEHPATTFPPAAAAIPAALAPSSPHTIIGSNPIAGRRIGAGGGATLSGVHSTATSHAPPASSAILTALNPTSASRPSSLRRMQQAALRNDHDEPASVGQHQSQSHTMPSSPLAGTAAASRTRSRHSRRRSNASEVSELDEAAQIIQNSWVNVNFERRERTRRDGRRRRGYQRSTGSIQDMIDARELNEEQRVYLDLTRNSYIFSVEAAGHQQKLQEYADVNRDRAAPPDDPHRIAEVEIDIANMDLEEPWIAPSVDFAKAAIALLDPRNEDNEETIGGNPSVAVEGAQATDPTEGLRIQRVETDISDHLRRAQFAYLGPGITNYFRFIRWCFWVFFALFILYLPALMFSLSGEAGLAGLGKTTIGNILPWVYVDHLTIPVCYLMTDWDCRMKLVDVATMMSVLDVTACVVVLIGFVWLRFSESVDLALHERSVVAPSQYSILVTNLPNGCTEMDIRAYFAKTIEKAVHDVVIIGDSERDIRNFRERGRLVKRRYHLTQECRYLNELIKRIRNEGSRVDVEAGRQYARRAKPSYGLSESKSCGKCLKLCKHDTGSSDDNSAAIELRSAPAVRPTRSAEFSVHSQIIVSQAELNSHIERFNKLKTERKQVTDAIFALDKDTIISGSEQSESSSAYVTFLIRDAVPVALDKLKSTFGECFYDNSDCRINGQRIFALPAQDPDTIIWENVGCNPYIRQLRIWFHFSLLALGVLVWGLMVVVLRGRERVTDDEGGLDVCPPGFFDLSESAQLSAVASSPGLLHCFCDFTQIMAHSECVNYHTELLVTWGVRAAVIVISLVLSNVADFVLFKLVPLEKHESTLSRDQSIFWRSFILRIAFYLVLYIFVISYFVDPSDFGRGDSKSVFKYNWYKNSGKAIIITQILNIVSPHLVNVYRYFQSTRKRAAAETEEAIVFTQDEMNELFEGPEFVVSHRYSQLLATFATCFVLATSIPLLPAIGVVSFFVQYWVDRLLLLRLYSNPGLCSPVVGREASSLIFYIVISHVVFAVWSLGNNSIFEKSEDYKAFGKNSWLYQKATVFHDVITLQYIIPLSVLFLLLLIILAFRLTIGNLLSLDFFLKRDCCMKWNKKSRYIKSAEHSKAKLSDLPLDRALRRGFVRGLQNYNILQNPVYRNAFGITDEFARTHKRIRSITLPSHRGISALEATRDTHLPGDSSGGGRAIMTEALTALALAETDAGGPSKPLTSVVGSGILWNGEPSASRVRRNNDSIGANSPDPPAPGPGFGGTEGDVSLDAPSDGLGATVLTKSLLDLRRDPADVVAYRKMKRFESERQLTPSVQPPQPAVSSVQNSSLAAAPTTGVATNTYRKNLGDGDVDRKVLVPKTANSPMRRDAETKPAPSSGAAGKHPSLVPNLPNADSNTQANRPRMPVEVHPAPPPLSSPSPKGGRKSFGGTDSLPLGANIPFFDPAVPFSKAMKPTPDLKPPMPPLSPVNHAEASSQFSSGNRTSSKPKDQVNQEVGSQVAVQLTGDPTYSSQTRPSPLRNIGTGPSKSRLIVDTDIPDDTSARDDRGTDAGTVAPEPSPNVLDVFDSAPENLQLQVISSGSDVNRGEADEYWI